MSVKYQQRFWRYNQSIKDYYKVSKIFQDDENSKRKCLTYKEEPNHK